MAARVLILRDAAGREHRVSLLPTGAIAVDGETFEVHPARDGSLQVLGPRNTTAWTAVLGDTTWVFLDGVVFTFERANRTARRRAGGSHDSLTAPMPSTVRKIAVGIGERVARGEVLVVLEAMKMELPIRAPADGTVSAVNCREGELVEAGRELVVLDM